MLPQSNIQELDPSIVIRAMEELGGACPEPSRAALSHIACAYEKLWSENKRLQRDAHHSPEENSAPSPLRPDQQLPSMSSLVELATANQLIGNMFLKAAKRKSQAEYLQHSGRNTSVAHIEHSVRNGQAFEDEEVTSQPPYHGDGRVNISAHHLEENSAEDQQSDVKHLMSGFVPHELLHLACERDFDTKIPEEEFVRIIDEMQNEGIIKIKVSGSMKLVELGTSWKGLDSGPDGEVRIQKSDVADATTKSPPATVRTSGRTVTNVRGLSRDQYDSFCYIESKPSDSSLWPKRHSRLKRLSWWFQDEKEQIVMVLKGMKQGAKEALEAREKVFSHVTTGY